MLDRESILNLCDSFERYPQLKEVSGITDDVLVMWDGAIAVVVQSPQTWIVYKIPHEWKWEIIDSEFKTHEWFLFALRKWRKEGVIPEYIKIPSIRHNPSEHNWVFAQERVDGLTLKSIQILLRDPRIKNEDRNGMLENFTDFDVKEYFINELWMDEDDFDFDYNCQAVDIIGDFVSQDRYEAFLWALEYMESQWCKHYDLHNSNVMIDRKWNIYIIDFWKLENETTN